MLTVAFDAAADDDDGLNVHATQQTVSVLCYCRAYVTLMTIIRPLCTQILFLKAHSPSNTQTDPINRKHLKPALILREF